MNRSRWLLLSLALNALLLLAVAWRWRPLLVPPSGSGADSSVTAAETSMAEAAQSASADPAGDAAPSVASFHWSQLDLADWPAYRDGLRRTGCPERTVREIIEPLVRRHFGQQMRALTAPYVSRFWELMATGDQAGHKSLETAMKALAERQRDALKNLFSSSTAPDEAPATGSEDGRLAFLPAPLREQVVAAQFRHQERIIQSARESENLSIAHKRMEPSQQTLDQELASLMSPDELAEFRRRHSQFAGLRKLEGIELSEAELAEIIRLKENKQTSPAAEAKELETLLGPERAADFERAQQPGYQELLRLTERLDVTPEKVRELWTDQRRIEQEAQTLAKDTSLREADRAAQMLAVLRESMRARAGQVLGERGQAAWERQQAGWLKRSFQLPEENPLAPLPSDP